MSTSIAILRAAGVTDAQILRIRELEEQAKPARKSAPIIRAGDWPANWAELFWENYPRHISKKAALDKLVKLNAAGLSWLTLFAGVLRYSAYCQGKEEKYIKHPTTWLNQGCWDDEHRGSNGNGVIDTCRDLVDEIRARRASEGFEREDFFGGSR